MFDENIPKLIGDCIVLAIYLVTLLATIFFAGKKWKEQGFKWKRFTTGFYLFLILFLLCRIPWQIVNNMLELESQAETMFVLNRLAHSFFLFAYSITLFYWIDTVQGTLNVLFSLQVVHGDVSSAFLSNKMKVALLVVCSFIFLFSLAIIIIYLATAKKTDPNGTVWYDVNIYVYAAIFLLFSLLYLVFGLKMYIRIRSRADETGNKKVNTFGIALLPVVCAICFFYRFVLLIWRPATNKYLPYGVYISGYVIAEAIPALVFLYNYSKEVTETESKMEEIQSLIAALEKREPVKYDFE